MAPETIGRYVIKSELGRGGMATVYLARDPSVNRDVAIKVLPAELLHDPSFRARFEREAQTIASLEHSSIVPVYDYGEIDGQPYFVMRLMTGGNLADRVAAGPLSVAEVARIIARLAPGLDDAHKKGIIHRDIKPANIMFDSHSDPYLSDFGIAKLTEAGASLTGSGIIGTPAYMSPEQGRGEADIDGRSDIYCLGVVIYEMLTGKIPYEADTPMGQVIKHLTSPVPNIQDTKPDLPPGCQEVINRAMAKKKFARFANATELAAALAAVAQGRPEEIGQIVAPAGGGPAPTLAPSAFGSPRRATPPPARRTPTGAGVAPARRTPSQPVATKPAPRKSRVGAVLFSVAIIAVLAIAGFTAGPQLLAALSPTEPPATATLEAPLPTYTPDWSPTPIPPTATNTPETTPIPQVVEAPTAEPTSIPETPVPTEAPAILAMSGGPVVGGADLMAFIKESDVWVVKLDGSDLTRMTNTGGSKTGLQFTPDGQFVTFVAGRCVQAVDISTGSVTTILCFNWTDYVASFEISPDGTQVAISSSDGLYILSYDLEMLGEIKRKDQLTGAKGCIAYTEVKTKAAHWSKDGTALGIIVIVTQSGRQVELIRVLDVSRCGQEPVYIDQFPGDRFQVARYSNTPIIQSFGWDGDMMFALNVSVLNDFGDMYTYNVSSHRENKISPIENQCCYRDFIWSPDGQYILFAFLDSRYASQVKLYIVEFGMLEAGGTMTPFPLPDGFLGPKEKPQPVLRPAQ